ncbi:hypothetical protein B0H13DRAFT_1907481 [Mycena leptocephala]|nr:hypothetical protein B0H13DRAFT_1907481 [Mycena leptocephala]
MTHVPVCAMDAIQFTKPNCQARSALYRIPVPLSPFILRVHTNLVTIFRVQRDRGIFVNGRSEFEAWARRAYTPSSMCGVDAFVDILLKCSFEIQVGVSVPVHLHSDRLPKPVTLMPRSADFGPQWHRIEANFGRFGLVPPSKAYLQPNTLAHLPPQNAAMAALDGGTVTDTTPIYCTSSSNQSTPDPGFAFPTSLCLEIYLGLCSTFLGHADGGSAFCDASIYAIQKLARKQTRPAFIPSPSAQRNRGIQTTGCPYRAASSTRAREDVRERMVLCGEATVHMYCLLNAHSGPQMSRRGKFSGGGGDRTREAASSHAQFAGMRLRAVGDVRMSVASMMHFRSLCIGVEAGSAFVYNGESCWMHTLIRIEGIGWSSHTADMAEKKQDSTQAKGLKYVRLGAGLETWSVETSRTSEVQVEADGVIAGSDLTGQHSDRSGRRKAERLGASNASTSSSKKKEA